MRKITRPSVALLSAMIVLATGCGSGQTAAPSSAPSAAPTTTSIPATRPPAGPTVIASPAATAAKQPTSPAATPSAAQPTRQPAATSTSASVGVLGQEYSFEQVVTASGQEAQTMKVAIKGQKIRMEFAQGGNSVVMIGNPEQKTAYMVIPSEKQAMKLPYEQFDVQKGLARDPGALSKEAFSGQPAGTETVDGKICDVYTYSGPLGSSKVWIWKEKGFPLKAEVSGSGQKISIEYRNVQVGGLPDSLFELPPDMQVLDLGSMPLPPNLPNMPSPKQ